MNVKEESHLATVLSSIAKAYNKSFLGKQIDATEIYLLDTIYDFINGCHLELTSTQLKKLKNLYQQLYLYSGSICKNLAVEKYKYTKSKHFTQKESTDFGGFEEAGIFTVEFNNIFS